MNVSNVQVAEATQTAARTVQATVQAKPATPPPGQNYYFSPTLRIDPKSQKVVLEYLNSQTGAVTYQYPSEKALAAYQQPTAAATPAQTQTVSAPTASATGTASSATGTASSAAGTAQAQVSKTASILA
jgi:hypothetical protein